MATLPLWLVEDYADTVVVDPATVDWAEVDTADFDLEVRQRPAQPVGAAGVGRGHPRPQPHTVDIQRLLSPLQRGRRVDACGPE